VTPEGFAIKGPEYAKAQQATLRAIADEPPGVGPVDLSRPVNIDSAPQSELQRVVPARGISARMQRALENPDVETGLRESIARGIEMGADKWYHTQPIRDAFIAELGPERGAEQFRRYMDYVAATSPRSDVATNIRNASYYYSRGDEPTVKADLRYPYGHMAQNLHLQNVGTIQSGGFNVLRNPKPASFSENLQGNLVPVTVDTHAFRNIGMRTRDPEFLETSISVPNKTGKAAKFLKTASQSSSARRSFTKRGASRWKMPCKFRHSGRQSRVRTNMLQQSSCMLALAESLICGRLIRSLLRGLVLAS
jgi:hypothetical protein